MKNNIAYMLAVVTMLLFAGCSNENEVDNIINDSDGFITKKNIFSSYWIVENRNVGETKVIITENTIAFVDIPYEAICRKVFTEDEMKGFNAKRDIHKNYNCALAIGYGLEGYSETDDSYYYNYHSNFSFFKVNINGTIYYVYISIKGNGIKVKTPYPQLISTLEVKRIDVGDTDRTCSTPLKIVNVAKL
ncbi:hypothetical protein [Prevotella koreensis]|uniref:hypothetical protein n=1 Tax=Prevotella koreensis TaxID=2490854 RepID=UPI0028E700D6|nr:hypothetical protein [Prevotella koreensis]